jgi:hypothetical protein
VQYAVQAKVLVWCISRLRPLLVSGCDYLDGDSVMSNEFMGGVYDGDSKRQELASDATMRDFFAAKAMQGDLSFGAIAPEARDETINLFANHYYRIADAMLKARNQ